MINNILGCFLAISLAAGILTNMFTRVRQEWCSSKPIKDSLYRKLMWIPLYGFYISDDYSKNVLKNKWWYWWGYHFTIIVIWAITSYYKI